MEFTKNLDKCLKHLFASVDNLIACTTVFKREEAGKHVLCEARMAMNAREAHDMLCAARSHMVAQVVPSPSSLKVDRTIQRLLAEGYIGDLLAIDVQDRGGILELDGAISWR